MAGKSLSQQAHELSEVELDTVLVELLEKYNYELSGFRYPLEEPAFYIKISATAAECRTQQYVSDTLNAMPPDLRRGIHVPRIFRVMDAPTHYFIIMEYIQGKTLLELQGNDYKRNSLLKEQYDLITKGLKLFLTIPAPLAATPGPVGGGIIHHSFFKDTEAPVEYDSIEMLEKHVNKIAHAYWPDEEVTFERELHLVFSDLYAGNFIFTDSGDLYIIDFCHASFLPLSFMSFTLNAPMLTSACVALAVRKQFDLPMENITAMRKAAAKIAMSTAKLCLPV